MEEVIHTMERNIFMNRWNPMDQAYLPYMGKSIEGNREVKDYVQHPEGGHLAHPPPD